MLITTRKKYKKKYAIGGSGLFDSISGFFQRLVSSNAAKQLASSALGVGKNVAKDVAKEIGKKVIDVGKSVAVDAGKRLVDKAAAKLFTPPKTQLTQENIARLDRLSSVGANAENMNLNNMMMGTGLKNAVSIQDLVRKLNGGGMKVA